MESPIRVANIALMNHEDSVLLLQRSRSLKHPHKWGFPGGMVDEGESPLDAAGRELYEEAAVNTDAYRVDGSRSFVVDNHGETIHITLFRAQLTSPVKIVINTEEHSAFKWIPVSQVPGLEHVIDDVPMMLSELLQHDEHEIL